jgi:hypothetical protein
MMKKLNLILMISALLLSISVQSAPVKGVESDGAKTSAMVIGLAIGAVFLGTAITTVVLADKQKKERGAKRLKASKARKAAWPALRIRAEAEYAHRHTRHWH